MSIRKMHMIGVFSSLCGFNPAGPLVNSLGQERTTLMVINKGTTNLIDASKGVGVDMGSERTR
jgi:hypothetical protein